MVIFYYWIINCCLLKVVAKNLYNQDSARTPVQFGALDNRMGTSQKDLNCTTCGKGLQDCVGHFGWVFFRGLDYRMGTRYFGECFVEAYTKGWAPDILGEFSSEA